MAVSFVQRLCHQSKPLAIFPWGPWIWISTDNCMAICPLTYFMENCTTTEVLFDWKFEDAKHDVNITSCKMLLYLVTTCAHCLVTDNKWKSRVTTREDPESTRILSVQSLHWSNTGAASWQAVNFTDPVHKISSAAGCQWSLLHYFWSRRWYHLLYCCPVSVTVSVQLTALSGVR